jgi:signal transduction histidine kinase
MNNVLFIDDDTEILDHYKGFLCKKKSALEELGDDIFSLDAEEEIDVFSQYNIFTATQGLEGIKIVTEQKEKGLPIKVAFIDMRMPPGIDGAETARRIREVDPNVEIVIVTAYSDTKLDDIIKMVGRPDKLLYLKKPYDPAEVRQLAYNLVEKYNVEKVKEEFLANVSHELSTPLSSILGFSKIIRSGNKLDKDDSESMEIIIRNASLMKTLVEDLISSIELQNKELNIRYSSVSINGLLKHLYTSMVPIIEKKAEITFLFQSLSNDVHITSDESRLLQVLINLTSNAYKFTESGSIEVIAEQSNKSISLSVRDTGIGMPLEKQKNVFERFVRLESEHHTAPGLGLGLAISKRIVHLLGGKISCESEEGVGSVFTVVLSKEMREP